MDGFYREDEALRDFPYNRAGETVEECYPFLMTDEDRQESQDVLGFARGVWNFEQEYYSTRYCYISSDAFSYTNLFAAFRTAYTNFDIYASYYPVTREMRDRIRSAAADHGPICRHACEELDE